MNLKEIKVLHISIFSLSIIFGVILAMCVGTEFAVDLWWFNSLGCTAYFALKEGYRDTIALMVTLILTVVFYINFRLASRFSGTEQGLKNMRKDTGLMARTLKNLFNKYYIILSVILSIPVLIPVYTNWETVLLFFFTRIILYIISIFGND